MNTGRTWAVALAAVVLGALAPVALGGESSARTVETVPAPGIGVVEGGADTQDAKAAGAKRGKTRVYSGRFTEVAGAKAKLSTTYRKGKPRAIRNIRYTNLPAICEQSGPSTVSWAFRFLRGALPVKRNRRFGVVGEDPTDGSTVMLRGRFSRNYKKVAGKFQTRTLFPAQDDPPLPEEFCATDTERFKASR